MLPLSNSWFLAQSLLSFCVLFCFVCFFFLFIYFFIFTHLAAKKIDKGKTKYGSSSLVVKFQILSSFDIFWATKQKCFSFQSFVIQEYRKDNICCKVLFTYIINKYRFLKRTEIPNENDFDNINSAASLLADVCMYLQ